MCSVIWFCLVTTYDHTVLISHLPREQSSVQDCVPEASFLRALHVEGVEVVVQAFSAWLGVFF